MCAAQDESLSFKIKLTATDSQPANSDDSVTPIDDGFISGDLQFRSIQEWQFGRPETRIRHDRFGQ